MVLHEQNILPGITNRVLVRLARRIYVSFEQTAGRLDPHKVRFTGNPVRREILDLTRGNGSRQPRPDARQMTLLIVGGSQGAHFINITMLSALPLLKEKRHLTVIHQTGAADESRLKEA